VVGRKIDANPGCGTQDKTRGNEGKQRENQRETEGKTENPLKN
jgi:hypothetical protein